MSMTPPGAQPHDPTLPPPPPSPSGTTPPPPPAYGTPPPPPPSGMAPAFGTQPAPAFGTQPPPAFGTQPAPAFGTQPAPAFGTQPPPAFGTQPPPGYVAYNEAGGYLGDTPLANTVGLRKWVSGLFILVTALAGISTWAQFARVGVVDDFIDGSASIFDVDDADGLVAITTLLQVVAMLTAAIVLSVWTLRTVRNAERLVGSGLKPRLAAGGWFIPIGNLWVSFAKLRQAVRPLKASTKNISWWQGMWIVFVVTGNTLVRSDPFNQPTFDEVRNALNTVAYAAVFNTVIAALAAFFALRALRDIETAIEQRRTQQK